MPRSRRSQRCTADQHIYQTNAFSAPIKKGPAEVEPEIRSPPKLGVMAGGWYVTSSYTCNLPKRSSTWLIYRAELMMMFGMPKKGAIRLMPGCSQSYWLRSNRHRMSVGEGKRV